MDHLNETERFQHVAKELSDGYDKDELDELEKKTQYAIKYADLQREHRENYVLSHKKRREIRHDKLEIERKQHHFLKLANYVIQYHKTKNLEKKAEIKLMIEYERAELKNLDFIDPITLNEELECLVQLLKFAPEDEKDEIESDIRSIKNELENEKLLSAIESLDEDLH